jgi:hypothetical protein
LELENKKLELLREQKIVEAGTTEEQRAEALRVA